ncbi:MAG: polysaccharide biosynthesis protein [Alphaproteobacteria bacterium]|nr:MAG: polysaccharide biosynthesis protein [Alphaproteobacteria bacterium]
MSRTADSAAGPVRPRVAKKESSLGRGAAYTVGPQLATLVVGLIVSPYIVSKIGLTAFGFWSVLQAFLAFAQIGNGGFPAIAARLVASADARGDRTTVREVFWVVVGASLGLAALMMLVAVGVVWAIPQSMARSWPHGWDTAVVAATGALGLLMLSRSLGAIVQGHHRWDYDATVLTVSQLGWGVAIVLSLEAGLGLPGLAVGAATPAVIGLVGYGAAVYSLVGSVSRPTFPGQPVRDAFRKQTVDLQIVMFVAAVNAQADRFLLLPFAPLSWVGAYALGSRMATALRSFPVAALAPAVARGSAEYETGGIPAVRKLYDRLLRLVIGTGVAGLLGLYGAMFPAVLAWLGPSFTISATAALVLGVGYAVNLTTGPGTALSLAMGRSDLDRKYSLIGLGLNVALSFPMGFAFGPWGVVAATGIGLSLSSAWLVWSIDGWLGSSWTHVFASDAQAGLRLAVCGCVGAAAVSVATAFPSEDRWFYLALAVAASGCTVVFLGLRPAAEYLEQRRLRRPSREAG